jgi:hypothetical protein
VRHRKAPARGWVPAAAAGRRAQALEDGASECGVRHKDVPAGTGARARLSAGGCRHRGKGPPQRRRLQAQGQGPASAPEAAGSRRRGAGGGAEAGTPGGRRSGRRSRRGWRGARRRTARATRAARPSPRTRPRRSRRPARRVPRGHRRKSLFFFHQRCWSNAVAGAARRCQQQRRNRAAASRAGRRTLSLTKSPQQNPIDSSNASTTWDVREPRLTGEAAKPGGPAAGGRTSCCRST